MAGGGGGGGKTEENDNVTSTFLDYTAFSVTIATLWLLLTVERLRCWLDFIARNDKFYTHVLSFLWNELATLGIVEVMVWLFHEHYVSFDIEYEHVFADVHFTFFFTAIANAVMTTVLHIWTMHDAMRNWLRLEELNINQYVLLRKNLRDARAELSVHNPKLLELYTERDLQNSANTAGLFFRQLGSYKLAKKYDKLTEQRRFHELRIHMIDANDLPKKFPVAKYLIECLKDVFLSQVHINLLAWLLLMALVEALYYAMGLVTLGCYNYGDKYHCDRTVGNSLIVVFVTGCVASAVLVLLAYIKMEQVFKQVIHRPELIAARVPKNANENAIFEEIKRNVNLKQTISPINASRRHSDLGQYLISQRQLFWFGHPSLVVRLFQLIQLGYAICASFIYVYRETIYEEEYRWLMFLSLVISYAVVLYLMVKTLPRYTLVTSLGHMIRSKFLFQVLANFHLEESLTRAHDEASNINEKNDQAKLSKSPSDHKFDSLHRFEFMSLDELLQKKDELRIDLNESFPSKKRRGRMVKSLSAGVSAMKITLGSGSNHSSKTMKKSMTKDDYALPAKPTPVSEPRPAALAKGRRHRRQRSLSAPDTIAQMRVDVETENKPVERSHTKPMPVLLEDIPSCKMDNALLNSEINVEQPQANSETELQEVSLRMQKSTDILERIKLFLQSWNYKLLSFLLGSMVGFFLLGMRIESLLIEDDILNNSNNTYQFDLIQSFWLLFMSLLLQSLEGLAFVCLFYKDREKRHFVYSGVFGAVVGFVSLALLVIAESKRSNGPFGDRKDGGVGQIEPWVAILLLRDMRWSVGTWIVNLLQKKKVNLMADFVNLIIHEDDHSHESSSKDEAVRLWRTTVESNPDLVGQYGEFSSELLQAMLGIKVPIVPMSKHDASYQTQRAKKEKSDSALSIFEEEFERIEVTYPLSFLLQPMRRGEIKLESLIDSWTIVDMILTKHELICLECFDDNGVDIALIDDGIVKPSDNRGYRAISKRRDVHDNLVMTSGGKGLMVGGVVTGRRILSRIDLSTVDKVRVHRRKNKKKSDSIDMTHEHIRSEYWSPSSDPMISSRNVDRGQDGIEPILDPVSELNRCWDEVNDDQLNIYSTQGLVSLRFIGDLETAERAKSNSIQGESEDYTSIALQWCNSIVVAQQSHGSRSNLDQNQMNDASQYLEIIDESLPRRKRIANRMSQRKLGSISRIQDHLV